MQIEIPDKPYFKIGEVSRLTALKDHVLRYWESEFPQVRPEKTRSGQRLYRRQDVELLIAIKRMLHEEGYTIAGARRRLKALSKPQKPEGEHAGELPDVDVLREVRRRMIALIDHIQQI